MIFRNDIHSDAKYFDLDKSTLGGAEAITNKDLPIKYQYIAHVSVQYWWGRVLQISLVQLLRWFSFFSFAYDIGHADSFQWIIAHSAIPPSLKKQEFHYLLDPTEPKQGRDAKNLTSSHRQGRSRFLLSALLLIIIVVLFIVVIVTIVVVIRLPKFPRHCSRLPSTSTPTLTLNPL